jgi:nicotinate-nucleotide pyrophosphorylase (carboxylating)
MWDPELGDIDGVIERALVEDLGAADVTSYATIPEGTLARARLVAKAPLVVCGMSVLTRVFS